MRYAQRDDVDTTPARPVRIGVFDSGVGGLSVLKALHERLSWAQFIYVADSKHAPYGEKSDRFIERRTHRIASHLIAHSIDLLVIACNTASAVAASSVRARWPALPVVALEPGVKPAVAISRNGRVGVMATPATLRSAKFKLLLERHSQGAMVVPQPCHGLAGAIEHGGMANEALDQLITRLTRPLIQQQVDTVVLGCTHYPFVRDQIQKSFGPNVELIDTADAVARQATRLISVHLGPASGSVLLQTTGSADKLKRLAAAWLAFDCITLQARAL